MASGSGHHLVLASGPSQLPAAILRGWCTRAVGGGAGCKPDLGVCPPLRCAGRLGGRRDKKYRQPTPSHSLPGKEARAPLSVPGAPRPLLKRAQPEHVACWAPADRHGAAQSPSATLGAGHLGSPDSGVQGESRPGVYLERPERREATFIFISGPYGANRRNMIFVTEHECKSQRLSNEAPETSTRQSNAICTETTCIYYKLHHKN